jgi:acyl transferase domain-containing protein
MNKTVANNKGASPLRRALKAVKEMSARLEKFERSAKEPIAIIGMGCRFPGNVNTPEEFWQLLRDGRDAVAEIPSERWDVDAYYADDPDAVGKMYTRCGGMLKEVDKFEPQFFGISPREAVGMDPQQRLLLEVSWEALERAGQNPQQLAGSQTGVFIGISSVDYATLLTQFRDPSLIDAYTGTGVSLSVAAGRISYVLGLQGPSVSMDTACSSSLVAVHMACQNLRTGKCGMALAGGANLILSPETNVYLSRVRALSPDGRCKTFDATADGYGRGDGCAMIVLKRLSDALANDDPIVALIRGSAVNHDGRTSGLTVPSSRAQQAVIREALADGNVEPLQVSYVEAHGTGTPLGDPIELESLSAVLCDGRDRKRPLLVGSVKTNVGHLEAAAGVAALIKVALALQYKEIPPHLHFKQPNPRFAWDENPIAVPTTSTPWLMEDGSRIAGVSSFGFSGTNAHVVMEEASQHEYKNNEFKNLEFPADRAVHLLKLSARDEEALREMALRLEGHLGKLTTAPIADICHTANVSRSDFSHRIALVCKSSEQLQESLSAVATGRAFSSVHRGIVKSTERPKVAFLFSGQDSQYVGIGRQLYVAQPTFQKALDRCSEMLQPYLPQPLLSVLYPETGTSSPTDETAYAQPALFGLEYALATLWRSWGIEPSAVMGHGVGEYVAACLAGVFSLEDGLKLTAERGRLMKTLPPGGTMAVIFTDAKKVAERIEAFTDTVSIAAINGLESTVISGAKNHLQSILQGLENDGISSALLNVSHAFNSPLMEPMLDDFEKVASEVKYSSPRISFICGTVGRPAAGVEVLNAAYWRRNVREPFRFYESIQTLRKQGYELFVQIGPRSEFSDMGRRCTAEDTSVWLPSLSNGEDDWQQMIESLGALYVRGVEVDWDGFDGDYTRRKVILPTYPFQRERYWIETVGPLHPKTAATSSEKPEAFQSALAGQEVCSAGQQTEPSMTRHAILAAESEERQDILESYLSRLVALELRLPLAKLQLHQPLPGLGFDSLMAIRVKNKIEHDLEMAMPIVRLLEGPSVSVLAASLREQLELNSKGGNTVQKPGFQTEEREIIEI